MQKQDILNWNLADIKWSKFMFPPKAKQVQGKPKGDTNIVKLFWSPLTKMNKQRRKICFRIYIFF